MAQTLMEPMVVRPQIYELPINLGLWCRVREVVETAQGIAQMVGLDFSINIHELIRRYVLLTRGETKKKFFRYSPNVHYLFFHEITPELLAGKFAFQFDDEGFVEERWATDVLRIIRAGCKEFRDFQQTGIVGIRETSSGSNEIFRLQNR